MLTNFSTTLMSATCPLSFYRETQFCLMIYDVESFNFYKQEEWLNQSINSNYAGLSLKLNLKHAFPIDAYWWDGSSVGNRASFSINIFYPVSTMGKMLWNYWNENTCIKHQYRIMQCYSTLGLELWFWCGNSTDDSIPLIFEVNFLSAILVNSCFVVFFSMVTDLSFKMLIRQIYNKFSHNFMVYFYSESNIP